jgi:hypothetical protein
MVEAGSPRLSPRTPALLTSPGRTLGPSDPWDPLVYSTDRTELMLWVELGFRCAAR